MKNAVKWVVSRSHQICMNQVIRTKEAHIVLLKESIYMIKPSPNDQFAVVVLIITRSLCCLAYRTVQMEI